jgi:hypothetical protein
MERRELVEIYENGQRKEICGEHPNIAKIKFGSASILLAMYIKRARCSHYKKIKSHIWDAPDLRGLDLGS